MIVFVSYFPKKVLSLTEKLYAWVASKLWMNKKWIEINCFLFQLPRLLLRRSRLLCFEMKFPYFRGGGGDGDTWVGVSNSMELHKLFVFLSSWPQEGGDGEEGVKNESEAWKYKWKFNLPLICKRNKIIDLISNYNSNNYNDGMTKCQGYK